MKLKLLIVLGAVVGGVAVAVRRRNQKASADAELWAEATDRVASSGA